MRQGQELVKHGFQSPDLVVIGPLPEESACKHYALYVYVMYVCNM